jgi:hypothetical protein
MTRAGPAPGDFERPAKWARPGLDRCSAGKVFDGALYVNLTVKKLKDALGNKQ